MKKASVKKKNLTKKIKGELVFNLRDPYEKEDFILHLQGPTMSSAISDFSEILRSFRKYSEYEGHKIETGPESKLISVLSDHFHELFKEFLY